MNSTVTKILIPIMVTKGAWGSRGQEAGGGVKREVKGGQREAEEERKVPSTRGDKVMCC